MKEFPLLRNSVRGGLQRAAEDLAMLMGGELFAEINEGSLAGRADYMAQIEGPILIIKIEVRGDCSGSIYCVQNLRDAIAFSSTLLGIPEQRIREKRMLSIFSDDDVDAYGEIGNQIAGSFNMVFEKGVVVRAHLKSAGVTSFNKDEEALDDLLPFPDGEYLLCCGNLQPEGVSTDRFDILVPLELATLIDQSVEELPAGDEAPLASLDAPSCRLLVVASHEAAAVILPMLTSAGFDVSHMPADADVATLDCGSQTIALVVSDRPDEQSMSVCLRLSGLSDITIVAMADNWTRSDIVRAMRYGVVDVILPTSDEILVERLRRVVK